jgi:hypothetical protein
LAGLKEQASQRIEEPRVDPDSPDWATKFYNDPQVTVQKEIADQTTPALQQAAATMGKMLLDQQKEAIDKEFGPGSWKEVFAERLDPVVAEAAKANPMSLMSPVAVKNAVDTVKGNNFATLAERAQKLAESDTGEPDKELVSQVADQVVQLTGGIRRVQPDGQEKLDDPESQEFLSTFFKQTGEKLDPGRLAKIMSMEGNTIDDYEAATKEKE